jgi:hypothetical protein
MSSSVPQWHTITMSDDNAYETSGESNIEMTRRNTLSLLGGGGLSQYLAGLSGEATGDRSRKRSGNQPWYDWQYAVNANSHSLLDLESVSMSRGSTAITDFTGANLSVDGQGVLNAQEVPESIHIVNNYPGDTLDQKIRNIIEDVPSADPVLPPGQPGHRIVVSAPDPADPAALNVDGSETPIWRWEAPVVFDDNRGKIVLDMGWTLIFATAAFESFFIIGPDQKTENITLNGGFLYARDKLTDSFIQFGNAGHCHLKELYLQSLEGTTPTGIRLGGTELTVKGVEVTGCTNTIVAENVVDLDIFNHRGGGGENSIVIDGCTGVSINSVHTGSTEPQSVRNDVVRLENSNGPNKNVTITEVRSALQAFDHHAGVNAVDVTDGNGEKHQNINIYAVDATGAEYGTDLDWVTDYDQQAIRPAPADPAPDGVTRHYESGTQSFRSASTHEFVTANEPSFVVREDGVEVAGAGNGIVLTTPNGESQYRVQLDNEGNLVTDEVGG